MSASLVGSEMCIRDSSCLAPLPHARCPPSSQLGSPRRLPARESFSSFVPVSYTHLTLPTICSV
eukprot:5976573-Alexandrium_andersonii.AAC.1